jgi:hypothetical protein
MEPTTGQLLDAATLAAELGGDAPSRERALLCLVRAQAAGYDYGSLLGAHPVRPLHLRSA